MSFVRDLLSWWRADEEFWRRHFTQSQQFSWFIRWSRGLFRLAPSDPRCKLCHAPFGGIGGRLFYLIGRGRSRKNPRFCTGCFEHAPLGGVEAEVGVLFADMRGFTSLAEAASPEEAARLVNRFYAVATDVLADYDAVIDKLMGDEVMALFLPAFTGDGCVEKMVLAAEGLLRGVGHGSKEGPWLPLGIGLDQGLAFVGNVGSGVVKDFTAIGDVVNTAARLQGEAAAGQVVMSERVYQAVSHRYPEARPVQLELKGKREPVQARVVTVA
jgi:adenylate cyclase